MKECRGCTKETSGDLRCPTCAKLDLPDAWFCGQECFKSSWVEHKIVHKKAQDAMARYRQMLSMVNQFGEVKSNFKLHSQKSLAFSHLSLGKDTLPRFNSEDRATWVNDPHLELFSKYKFTGQLRPWPVTPQRVVPDSIAKPDYADHVNGVSVCEMQDESRLPSVQSPDVVSRMRECCLIARKALDLAHSMCKPGITTDEIDQSVHEYIVGQGGYPSPLNYFNFPKSLCSSVNEVVCHGIPDLRPLQAGDIINFDITVYYKGVHGDLNETVAVGDVDKDSLRLMQGTYESLMQAIAECRPGVLYKNLGHHIQAVAQQHNLSVVKTYCGHGVGELFHTAPNVPHYRGNKTKGIMAPGHIFTIEPMLNLGTFKDELWPDEWTAVTCDGRRSAQYEHTLLVTDTGVEVLTARLESSPPLPFSC
ncbi:MAG: uncharacterized protein KVP18_003209 [Porospora cf. gigantea A]|uniref:uncharacterized protein n=2 Tax=Porospora cf. gigantea A TaxID=2853593 RepID=UPI0035593D00|nr:MAG: hypothetical protein KVP18_003209 [Porospora cf. gigantea A]